MRSFAKVPAASDAASCEYENSKEIMKVPAACPRIARRSVSCHISMSIVSPSGYGQHDN